MSTYVKSPVRIATAASCLLVVCALSFTPILPGSVEKAHAQLPVTDVAVLAAVSTTGGTTAAQTTYTAHIKPILDGLQWAVAKAAIQAITKSMVNWINSGFNGSPAFVTNLQQNLLGVSDGAANAFFAALSNHSGNTIASPFQNAITQQLRNDYYSSTGRSVAGGYNLNQFSSNPAAFLAGTNFGGTGGFSAWFAAVGNNQNNPYGAAYAQQNALNSAIYSATTNQLNELNWGKGFLSWKGPCTSKAPTAIANDDYAAAAASATSLSGANNCTSNSIKTPGSIIEDTLGITATSPLRQLELSNSINQIVGALASQLINQVVGATGLSGVSQPSAGGGPSPLAQATNPSQYTQAQQTTPATGFLQTVENDLNNTSLYLTSWQSIQSTAKSCVSTDPQVAAALTLANTNVARATAAMNELTAIATGATAALTSNDQSTIASLTTRHDNLVATTTSIYVQPADIADAQTQSAVIPNGTSLASVLSSLCSTSI